MDFHGLSRKELQTLCKKNKIPANMTNIAMADALKALTNVEGIEEIESLTTASEKPQPVPESPYTSGRASSRRKPAKDHVVPIENENESNLLLRQTRSRARKIIQEDEQEPNDPKDSSENPSVTESPRTCLRSSTRRRPVKNHDVLIENNPGSSKRIAQTRCRTRSTKQEEEQSNKDLHDSTENPSPTAVMPKTPAWRRRGAGTSVRKVNEIHRKEDKEDEEKDEKQQDPVIAGVYSTRRSSRLQSKMLDANQKTGRRTETVQIASMSEEENEELTKKSTSVENEIIEVSVGNEVLGLISSVECDSNIHDQQENFYPEDESAKRISASASSSVDSSVPEQSTCENISYLEEEKSILENSSAHLCPVSEDASAEAIQGDLISEDTSVAGVSAEIFEGITSLVPEHLIVVQTLNSEADQSKADESISLEKHLIKDDASTAEVSAEISEGITSLVPEHFTVEQTLNLGANESKADDSNAPEEYLVKGDGSAPVISAECLHNINTIVPECSTEQKALQDVEIVTDIPEHLTVEQTLNLGADESKADDSIALEEYLVKGDGSAPVTSAGCLHSINTLVPECSTEQKALQDFATVTDISENIESTNAAKLGFQVIPKDKLCEDVSCELPPSLETSEDSSLEDSELPHCKSQAGIQSEADHAVDGPLDKQMIISINKEKSSCLSEDQHPEHEELNNNGTTVDACVNTDQDFESIGDLQPNETHGLGLQVVINLHAEGSVEILSSLSEIWDFREMKDSIQECLNELDEEKCNSDSVPLDIEVLGEMESGNEIWSTMLGELESGKHSMEDPSHLDYSTDIAGLKRCTAHDSDILSMAADSIVETLDEKMVVSENNDFVLEHDAHNELSFLPNDLKLGTQKSKQTEDVSDADSMATANDTTKIFCSDVSGTGECCEKSGSETSPDVHKPTPPLSCDVSLLDEIPLPSAAVPCLSQVPSCLTPSRGLTSESGYHINQTNVTPSKSSIKKKATPSQRKAFIMVLDENKDNCSGGMSLKKKSSSKLTTSAAKEKENRDNHSGGGLSLRNKSNSKVVSLVAEEKNNKCEDSIQRTLKNTSLRQLKKMFKEKLIVDSTGDRKNNVVKGQQHLEKTRAALQTLTDNSLVSNRET